MAVMRLAEPRLFSAYAKSPDWAPPRPHVRTATAARLKQCCVIAMAPTLGWRCRRLGRPKSQRRLFAEFVNCEVGIAGFIALTAGNLTRISPRLCGNVRTSWT